jgi:MFS family permease
VLGYNPLLSGLAYLPITGTVFCISHFIPALVAKFGSRSLLITGSVLVAISLIGFSRLNSDSTYLKALILPLFVHSIGIAMVFVPGSTLSLENVKKEDAGVVSGILQVSQQIGGAIGIAAIISVYTASLKADDFSSGLSNAFMAASIISLAAAVITVFYVPRKSTAIGTEKKAQSQGAN